MDSDFTIFGDITDCYNVTELESNSHIIEVHLDKSYKSLGLYIILIIPKRKIILNLNNVKNKNTSILWSF